MNAHGTIYGYGDNSKDQIMAGKEVVLNRPQVIKKARQYAHDLIRMHTNDDSSMMTVFDKKIAAPVMFQWGGKNIIESNMAQVIDGGTTLNPEAGVYIRGGSQYDSELIVVDQYKNGQQPFYMFSGHSNITLI